MVSDHFEQIVAQHYEPLYKFAFSLTRTEADASDLTQQTFYVWATKGHQLRERSKVKTWLFTTLHRTFLGTQRKQNRFPHQGLEEIPLEDMPGVSPDVVNEADLPQVLLALGKVDEVYQAAVALFYLQDCSYKEIAEILAVPMGTVKSRLARGIVQLRALLGFVESESAPPSISRQVNENLSRGDADSDTICVQSDLASRGDYPCSNRRETHLPATLVADGYPEMFWNVTRRTHEINRVCKGTIASAVPLTN